MGARIGSTTTSVLYSDLAVVNGTTYYYRVTATNASEESLPSAQVSATPAVLPPPAAPAVVAGNAQVQLSWTTVSGATTYKVYRSSVPGMPGTLIASPSGLTFLDTGLVNGVTYSYSLVASNAQGTRCRVPRRAPRPTSRSGPGPSRRVRPRTSSEASRSIRRGARSTPSARRPAPGCSGSETR